MVKVLLAQKGCGLVWGLRSQPVATHSLLRTKSLEKKSIPLHDRQLALSLLLELVLQRGTLEHMLGTSLLLLQLSAHVKMEAVHKDLSDGEDCIPSNEDERVAPLVPFLRKLMAIPTPSSPFLGFPGTGNVSWGNYELYYISKNSERCVCVEIHMTTI